MNRIRRSAQKGFTLVEILIVVIILGILAAIVIPQFTNASQDARKNSLTSQLQTIRSQIELYKLQHLDKLPPLLVAADATNPWLDMCRKTSADHTSVAASQFGPYLQAPPMNPLNNKFTVAVVATTTDYGSGGVASPDATVGFILNTDTGKIWATSAQGGYIYNEGDPSDPHNLSDN